MFDYFVVLFSFFFLRDLLKMKANESVKNCGKGKEIEKQQSIENRNERGKINIEFGLDRALLEYLYDENMCECDVFCECVQRQLCVTSRKRNCKSIALIKIVQRVIQKKTTVVLKRGVKCIICLVLYCENT